MKYSWIDYEPDSMCYVEEWLDEEARRQTGMEEGGWRAEYEYWTNKDGNTPEFDCMEQGTNYWNKIIFQNCVPVGIIELSFYEGNLHVMEILVAPTLRGLGHGTDILKELMYDCESVLGKKVCSMDAVVFSNNAASRKAFEKAGYSVKSEDLENKSLSYQWA